MNCTPDNGVINEGQLPLAGKNEGTLSLQQCCWLASRVNYGFCAVMGEAADIRERLPSHAATLTPLKTSNTERKQPWSQLPAHME